MFRVLARARKRRAGPRVFADRARPRARLRLGTPCSVRRCPPSLSGGILQREATATRNAMHTPLAPLLTALLALAAPPPPQTTTTRSPGDNTVESVGGKTFHQWTDDLKNPDPSVREEAIRALVRFGHDTPRAIPLLI